MTNGVLQAKTTKTAAFTGTTELDISGIDKDWTIVLEVMEQADANISRFVFQDTVDNFTANLSGPSASVSGKVTLASGPRRYCWKKADFPSLRFNVASAELRLVLAEIKGGSSQSVTYQAWVEY
jgi:hypothetical protein